MSDFRGKSAVVTGAGGGIGREIVARCVREGMRVVLAVSDGDGLADLRNSLAASGEVHAEVVDVSDPDAVERLAGRAVATFGAVDFLFNNAGVQTYSTSWEASLAEWKWVIGVNLFGVVHGIKF